MGVRVVLVGVLCVVRAATVAAGEPRVYDLGECIHAALASNADLSAAAADLAGARARLAEAQAGRFGNSEYNQVLGFVNEARGNPVSSPDNKNALLSGLGPFTRLDLEINIPLWTFGKLDAALAAAQGGLESERARGAAKRADVVLNTKQLYYGLLLARQLSAVLHDMLDTLDKAVKTSQERLDTGSKDVTEIDVLKLRIGRAKFAKGVVEVDASMALTRSALARAIGAGEMDFDIADRRLEPTIATVAPLDTYLTTGANARPESEQLRTGLAAQSAKVNLEEASYYPTLFFGTGLQFAHANNRTEQTNPFASDDFNYVRPIGVVGLHWDLNFFMTAAKVEEARAELDRLQAQQRDAATGLALEIRRAYSDVLQARDTMTAAEDGRRAGRALLILTISNFDLGIGEAEELFKGLGSYTEASTDYLRAVHDYNVSLGVLSRSIGKEITTLQY